MMPPCGFSMQLYRALPGVARRATSLATRRRRKAVASAPPTSTLSMCETSNMPASWRTAWCSSSCEP
ncbi:Uncharacterised protein [Bordetella pertussis]|nr:Uncharacterised protein [Bordetella pertussis]CFW12237.1 Uncharacterised protein [Bordetella pertussis]CFW46163.1 Uncharacterised protein [Bordetella pertussis]